MNASPGLTGVPRWSAFVASKAALNGPADSYACELSVLPG